MVELSNHSGGHWQSHIGYMAPGGRPRNTHHKSIEEADRLVWAEIFPRADHAKIAIIVRRKTLSRPMRYVPNHMHSLLITFQVVTVEIISCHVVCACNDKRAESLHACCRSGTQPRLGHRFLYPFVHHIKTPSMIALSVVSHFCNVQQIPFPELLGSTSVKSCIASVRNVDCGVSQCRISERIF